MKKTAQIGEIAKLIILTLACVICFCLSFKIPSIFCENLDARSQSFSPEWFIGGGMFAFMLGFELNCYKHERENKKGEE